MNEIKPSDFRNAMWREDERSAEKMLAVHGIGAEPRFTNLAQAINSADNLALGVKELSKIVNSPEFFEKCRSLKPDALAKTFSMLVKPLDELVRLTEFAKGNADKRTEIVGLGDLLKLLTDEQANLLHTWIDVGVNATSSP